MGRRKRRGLPDEAARLRDRVTDRYGSLRAFHRAVQGKGALKSFETVRKIVQGDRPPTDVQRAAIAEALGVTAHWLAHGMEFHEAVLAKQDELRERGLALSFNAADVEATRRIPEPRRTAILRFGRLLDGARPREVRRAPRRTELVQPFSHPGDRAPVLAAAACYLEAAEMAVRDSPAARDDGPIAVPDGLAYVVWSDLLLGTFALTLREPS